MAAMEKKEQSLTLEEIGRRAGVSKSTVSRVLNDHPNVRAEVREQVRAVVAETGYQPHPAARALATKRSGLIGLVILTDVEELFGDPYYSALVNGIQKGCADHGLVFSILPVPAAATVSTAVVRQIDLGLVDGVIITAGPRSDGLIADLRALGTRMVVVGQPADDSGVQRVDVENRLGAREAVRHLLADGYRRIGFVGATPEFAFGVERLAGYRDAMNESGQTPHERLISLGQPTEEGGRTATLALLWEKPDAIFVATDSMAAGAYQALGLRGLRVPEDVAIFGFDGLPRGSRLRPELSTVVQPVSEVGRIAVAMLAGKDDSATVVLPTSLRLARSCSRNGALHRER